MKGIDDKAKAIADKISKYNTGRVSVSSDDTAVIPKNTAGRSIASSHVVSIVQDKVDIFLHAVRYISQTIQIRH